MKIRLAGIRKAKKECTIETTNDITSFEFDVDNQVIHLKKNNEYLKWKMNYRNLQSFIIKNKSGKLAEVIYTIDDFKGFSSICLYSFHIYKNTSFPKKTLLKLSIYYLLKTYRESVFIRFWCTGNDLKAVKSVGFLRSKHHNPFIVFPINCDAALANVIVSDKNWRLTYMDLD